MNLLERLLLSALVTVLLAAGGLFTWQVAQRREAEDAVRNYLKLEQDEAQADEAEAERIKKARAGVRRKLLDGDYSEANDQLVAFERTGESVRKKGGKELPLEKLLPPKSPERKKLKALLAQFLTKQQQGFDVEPTRETLVQLATQVRAGKRAAALKLIDEAGQVLGAAPLRPGFKPPSAATAATDSQVPPLLDPRMRQMVLQRALGEVQNLDRMLALARDNAPEAQRRILDRLRNLLPEMAAAVKAGRDIRPVMRVGERLRGAIESGNMEAAERLVSQMGRALRTAPLVPGLAGVPLAPGSPPPTGIRPGMPSGTVTPPPPASPPGGIADALVGAQLDRLRSLPEPEYRRARAQLSRQLAGLLSQSRPATDQAPATTRIGESTSIQLSLTADGRLQSWTMAGQPQSEGLAPGGIFLKGREALFLPLKWSAASAESTTGVWSGTAALPGGGQASLSVRAEGGAVVIQLEYRGGRADLTPVLVLPFRAAGRELGSGSGEVIRLGASYQLEESTEGITLLGSDEKSGTRVIAGLRLFSTGAEGIFIESNKLTIRPRRVTAAPTRLTVRLSTVGTESKSP